MSSHFDQEVFGQVALQSWLQGQAKVMMEKIHLRAQFDHQPFL